MHEPIVLFAESFRSTMRTASNPSLFRSSFGRKGIHSSEMQVASSSNATRNTPSRWDNPTRPESFRLPKQPCRNPRPLLLDNSDHMPRSPRRTFTPDPVDGCLRRAVSPNSAYDHFAQDQTVRSETSPRKPVRTVSNDVDALLFGDACGATNTTALATKTTTTTAKKKKTSKKESDSQRGSTPYLAECV